MNNKKLAALLACIAAIFVIGYLVGSAAGKRHNTETDYGLQVTTVAPDEGFSLEIVTEGAEETEPATEAVTEEAEGATKPAKTTKLQEKATKAAKTTAAKSTKAPKTQKPTKAERPATTTEAVTESWTDWDDSSYVEYHFRNKKLLDQHWEKHGGEFKKEFGYADASEYEKGASDVINNPQALTKTEAEDGDYIYYIEDTNEFVVLSKDGFIRTYFRPNSGKKYFDRQ